MSLAAERLLLLVRDRLALDARRVAPRVTRRIFGGASLRRCDVTCCRRGVVVSTAERDAILAHCEPVAAAMEASPRAGVRPRQAAWFTRCEKPDKDFLAGRSVDARVLSGSCVFLRADRLCAVQIASERAAGHPYALKPAYCIIFPLCVDGRTLDVCMGSYTRRPECCSPVRDGRRTPLAILAAVTSILETAPSRLTSRSVRCAPM